MRKQSLIAISGVLAVLGIFFVLGMASATPVSAELTPEDIGSCFDEKNHGQCVVCCKASGFSANACAKACFVINK